MTISLLQPSPPCTLLFRTWLDDQSNSLSGSLLTQDVLLRLLIAWDLIGIQRHERLQHMRKMFAYVYGGGFSSTTHTVGNYISLGSSFAIHSFYSLLRSSLTHGIPPHISKDQFDVPVPTVRNLLSTGQESEKRTRAAESFIQLYSLTQILGDIPLTSNFQV